MKIFIRKGGFESMGKIVPNLWFDTQADEASTFYTSLFKDSKIRSRTFLHDTPSGTADLISVSLAGQEFLLLSAGPYFKFNPSVSFMVACDSADEVDFLWGKLISGGEALMPLDAYPFSRKYGWVIDRYGLSWQLMEMEGFDPHQKITPTLMFAGDLCGKAEEAVRFYGSVFHHSAVGEFSRYGADEAPNKEGTVNYSRFTLEKLDFSAMDSAYDHGFTFNEAVSFVINCETQAEIDYYWEKLSAVPEAEQCGWLKDQYGVSWQVVPTLMNKMMAEGTPRQIAQVTEAFLKMKKFDIAELVRAYEQ